jgi:hypothetical protein
MLGCLRLTVKDAMKELHTLGKKLEASMTNGSLEPDKALKTLKEGIKDMLKSHSISPDQSLEDQLPSNCKVYVSRSEKLARILICS